MYLREFPRVDMAQVMQQLEGQKLLTDNIQTVHVNIYFVT